ncbi:NADH dehydrogenase FAD-containing subunit [Pedobacter nutrimenti]|jgi:NADH dehydrogenase|uniref:NADH:ubiquinone reductase (non-electrogenic) n=2 Tax=Pedobacter nutrimenti TaxID=1241337 RepID=A0A318U9U0_9SPHI|nr:NADH dehydrogenase FAD-containing subunit [Pedobacter nutrimenti]|eukprot:gene17605-21001_t
MQENIVIIGGGFAGINLAKDLGRNKKFSVTLVDQNNYNFFPPLIYQVATGFLEPSSISYPFRKLFAGKDNLHFRLGKLQKVLPAENKVILNNGELSYDVLVFATGAETNFFGNENIRKNAIPMKTLGDAIAMRNILLMRMEQASISKDPQEVKKLLTLVIAGGGPTGVEISGMFAEMKQGILRKDYPELKGKAGGIYLVDGGKCVLSPMSEKSQKNTAQALTKMGVELIMNTHVDDFENDTVMLSGGKTISTRNLIWAAGVTARVFEGIPAESYGRGKRMICDAFNLVKGTANIYAIGDTCLQNNDVNFPDGHPQVAQVAIQQGKNLARNFKRKAEGKEMEAFAYHDKGSMAIIGSAKAVVDLTLPKMHLKGFLAWLAWLFIHLMSLITYRNRARTFWNWMIAYFSKDQSLRMIIRPVEEENVT